MDPDQCSLVTGCFIGVSLLFHLFSARNFLPDEEIRLLGNAFWYLHYLMNLIARVMLLSAGSIIGTEIYKPNMVLRLASISRTELKSYLLKMLGLATLCIFARFITPGPVTSFGFFYKLSLVASFAATAIIVAEDGGAAMQGFSSPFKRKLGIKKKAASVDSVDQREDYRRSDSVSSIPPSKRQLTAMELLQTETTYIRNLKIIIEIYKQPLEKAAKAGKPILPAEDVKNAFGGIAEILSVHSQMHQELSEVISDWQEECCIAEIITKYQSQLTKVYPPYVNYFDMGKDIILKQQKSNASFMEFLVDCFNNPTCLKQPLDALLIRPVQRLPSMSLLINDLQRRTPETMRDHAELEKAKESLKLVLSHINEDKRKTEGKTKIFDIIYEVESCPVEIVSSNRLFVARINVTSLNEGLYRAGDRLAIYLLTDMIEVSKFKRSKGNVLLKHIRMLPLTDIKLVIDINDSEESLNMFAIQLADELSEKSLNSESCYHNPNMDKMCVCQVFDDRTYKEDFLQKLERQIQACREKISDEPVRQKMSSSDVKLLLKRDASRVFRKARNKPKRD